MDEVRIKSPDNPHAVMAYVAPAAISAQYVISGVPPNALTCLVGPAWALALMLSMLLASVGALVAVLASRRYRVPVTGLRAEAWSLVALFLVVGVYVWSLLAAYAVSVPATLTWSSASLVGTGWRLAQVARDLRRVRAVRRAVIE